MDPKTETLWSEFIAHLKERGLDGVKLVLFEGHTGLTKAIRRQLQGYVWQHCRAHFVRNQLQRTPKAHQDMVTGAADRVFAQLTAEDRVTLD